MPGSVIGQEGRVGGWSIPEIQFDHDKARYRTRNRADDIGNSDKIIACLGLLDVGKRESCVGFTGKRNRAQEPLIGERLSARSRHGKRHAAACSIGTSLWL